MVCRMRGGGGRGERSDEQRGIGLRRGANGTEEGDVGDVCAFVSEVVDSRLSLSVIRVTIRGKRSSQRSLAAWKTRFHFKLHVCNCG